MPSCSDGDTYYPVDDAGSDPTTCASTQAGFGTVANYVQAREYIAWTEGTSGSSNITTTESIDSVLARLNSLFATLVDYISWRPGTLGNYDPGEFGTYNGSYSADYEDADVRADYGNPPTVWSVDTDNCGGAFCKEGDEGALTVNNQDSGDLESTGGFFRATMKFFAAADKNQLPIRRLIVDWQDGGDPTGSDDTENYYKNHRGLQEDSTSVSLCDLCENDLDITDSQECEWGLTAESCDPNYFNYSHTYRCSENDLDTMATCSDTNGDGILDESPCVSTQGDSCVYQPRIHVRDNWGWCTGVCTAGTDSTDGCFDSGSLGSDGSYREDECLYANSSTVSLGNDPFIYYDGYIYVEP